MIDYFVQNPASFWFLVGFLLLAIEVVAFGMGSGVLLFGSFGAILTGIAFWLQWFPSSWMLGIAAFAISSVFCAAVLWKPLKKMQEGTELGNDRSSDLIGLEFRLDEELSINRSASTKYSGIDWRVELDDNAGQSELAVGERVRVNRVEVGVFYVLPAS